MVAAGVAIFIPGEDGGSLPGQEDEVLEAVRMCVEAGTDVDAVNDRRETALHGAAFRGVNAVVEATGFHQGSQPVCRVRLGLEEVGVAEAVGEGQRGPPLDRACVEGRALLDQVVDADGQRIDPAVCLECFQTRPDQVRAAIARDERMAAELAAGLR